MDMNWNATRVAPSILAGIMGLVMVSVSGIAYASNYSALVQRGSSAFKTKFAPTSELLAISDGEVTLPSVVGETFALQWRVFIPPGTKTLQMTMYTLASAPESKVLMRFGSPPTGTAANVTPENAAAVDITKIVQRLTSNTNLELPFSAPASAGAIRLSGRSSELTQTILTTTGGWLYINALQVPGSRIFELNSSVTVDESCYRSWFADAQFDALGNPAEDVVHTCAGPIPLTSIALSGNSLVKGSNNTITITPSPSAASTSSCTPVYGSGVSNLVNIHNGVISLAAGSYSITSSQTVTIQCGTASATLRVEPTFVALTGIALSASSLLKGSTNTVSISPLPSNASLPQCTALNSFGTSSSQLQITPAGVISNVASSAAISDTLVLTIQCGTVSAPLSLIAPMQVVESGTPDSLVLSFDWAPEAADLGSAANVWIAARLPASAFFVTTDTWFFNTRPAWQLLLLPNADLYRYTSFTSLAAKHTISFETGLPKDAMKYYGLEIYMGYRTTTGAFKNLGKIWPQ